MRKLGMVIGVTVLGLVASASASLTNLETVVKRDMRGGSVHDREFLSKINGNTATLSNEVADLNGKVDVGVTKTSTVVTNLVPTYTTNVYAVLDSTTNAVSITNIVPTYTAATAAFKFASGIATNSP